MTQIHGHEVLDMMMHSGKTYTRQSLLEDIITRFGLQTRFYTCSAENMTAEQLIDFLDTRGKLVWQGSGFQTAADRICKH